MHEERNLYPLRPPLGCIEIHSDPTRRLYVSDLPEPAKETIKRPSKAEEIANILSGVITAGSSVAMVWLVGRVAGMI